jgi:hypothetical protein
MYVQATRVQPFNDTSIICPTSIYYMSKPPSPNIRSLERHGLESLGSFLLYTSTIPYHLQDHSPHELSHVSIRHVPLRYIAPIVSSSQCMRVCPPRFSHDCFLHLRQHPYGWFHVGEHSAHTCICSPSISLTFQ